MTVENTPTSTSRMRMIAGLLLAGAIVAMLVLAWQTKELPQQEQPETEEKAGDKKFESFQAQLPPPYDLDHGIKAATAYLNRHIDTEGRFTYRTHVENRKLKAKYNVLRHAGSVYALASLKERGSIDEETKSTILRSAKYLLGRYVDEVAGMEGISAVFSRPEEEGLKSGAREAKLGGAALGIIALLAAREIDEQAIPLSKIQSIGQFILFMQQEDGGFRSKYSETQKFAVDFKSLYYPGEAILALTRLYRADNDTKWLLAAARATAFLVNSRKGTSKLPPDHWLLIASNELLANYDALSNAPIDAALIYDHVVAIANMMLGEQERIKKNDGPEGSFLSDGRCTPTTTRLEGLYALYQLAGRRQDAGMQNRLYSALLSGGKLTLRCQYRGGGKFDGGVVQAVEKKRKKSKRNRKFNRQQGEIRIDYVQHALSAMIGLAELCDSKGGCPGL